MHTRMFLYLEYPVLPLLHKQQVQRLLKQRLDAGVLLGRKKAKLLGHLGIKVARYEALAFPGWSL